MNEVAALYIAYFAARSDDHVRWNGTTWQRAGAPLTPDLVIAAFRSGVPLSAYLMTPANTTHVAAIDFDLPDGLALARRLRAAIPTPTYVEASRRGAHLWVVLDSVIWAKTVRRALRGFLAAALIPEGPKIEIRPSHDTIKPDGFGSPIRLPTMPHPITGSRYPMYDAADVPISGRLDKMLPEIEWADADVFVEMAAKTPARRADLDASYDTPKPYRPPGPVESVSDVLREVWSVQNARPGHSVRCPAHDDRIASLSILRDDERVICKSPACEFNNNDHGRGPAELRKLAQGRMMTVAG